MRVIDAAIAFARKIERPLKVSWRMDDRLNCPLSELFEYTDNFGQVEEHKYAGFFLRLRRRTRIALLQLTGGVYLHHSTVDKYLKQKRSFEALKRYRKIFISSWDHFYPSSGFNQNFVPVNALLSKIEEITSINKDLIGVHIRRSDHDHSIERSPLWRFIELMEEEIELDPQLKFFLATDSPEVQTTLKKQFPNRIVTHSKMSLDRNDPRAIQDAVIDLYCLAACRKLIGSYRSSYSDMAWKLRGIDKIIVNTQEHKEAKPIKH